VIQSQLCAWRGTIHYELNRVYYHHHPFFFFLLCVVRGVFFFPFQGDLYITAECRVELGRGYSIYLLALLFFFLSCVCVSTKHKRQQQQQHRHQREQKHIV
jgi:hypothetical protein